MEIRLKNNTLNPLMVTGAKNHIQGASRDVLSFIFPSSESLENLDNIFSKENCESITIVDDAGNENIHKGYTIRAELKKESVLVEQATTESEATYEERITVSMAQISYTEKQLNDMQETLDALVLESLMKGGINMFNTIKRLYAKTQDKDIVRAAVDKGWITEQQYNEIIGE